MSDRTSGLHGHRTANGNRDLNSPALTEKRGRGRPPSRPLPWEPPLNVSPEALAQAILRPPKTEDKNTVTTHPTRVGVTLV